MGEVIVPDISKWQKDVDFDQMKAAGAKAVIIRAGSANASTGKTYTDHKWDRNIDLAPQSLPVVAAYWYYRPQHSPEEQADYFLERLAECQFPVVPAPDFETAGGLGGTALNASMLKFCKRIQAGREDKRLLDYTRGSFWNPFVGDPNWIDDNHLLWVARYSNMLAGPWSDGRYRPQSWNEYLFWQWSADGNFRAQEFGGGDNVHHIDLNRFNGSEQELLAFIDPDAPPPLLNGDLETRLQIVERATRELADWAESYSD